MPDSSSFSFPKKKGEQAVFKQHKTYITYVYGMLSIPLIMSFLFVAYPKKKLKTKMKHRSSATEIIIYYYTYILHDSK